MNQLNFNHVQADTALQRRSIQASSPDVLADIYQDDINISIWHRPSSPALLEAVEYVLNLNHAFRFSAALAPQDIEEQLYKSLGENAQARLISSDVAEIAAMFSCLFELDQVGLRLTVLERAMCPKFHVDRVPCRLLSTYSGIATEWLSHQDVDRSKLGVGSQGKTDEESGLYRSADDIHQLNSGDVALLKGESWIGEQGSNEGGGLVHRSPHVSEVNKRLLLTVDF